MIPLSQYLTQHSIKKFFEVAEKSPLFLIYSALSTVSVLRHVDNVIELFGANWMLKLLDRLVNISRSQSLSRCLTDPVMHAVSALCAVPLHTDREAWACNEQQQDDDRRE
jgi:hypothetical protein